ncbi:MAG: nitronate monooxygenase [Rhodobacteraceae bacterium]|nr:nitronate monooxygenase [Paracoccaceae bacterium]
MRHRATEILDRIGLKHPIFQAPMAGVSTPAMAGAVSQAGGLGSLGLGASTVDQARQMIRDARAAGATPLNVNFFCHRPAEPRPDAEADWLRRMGPLFDQFEGSAPERLTEIYLSFLHNAAMQQMVLEEKPEVVTFHFGLPGAGLISDLREAGCFLAASATSLEEAHAIQAAGLDAIIAQGIEAGGHRGIFDPDGPDAGLSSLTLTQLIVRECHLPVIAAGGIMTGQGIAAALNVGAVAAQLGTAFIATDESAADADYRQALVGSPGLRTHLSPAISGRPARCLGNALIDWTRDQMGAELPDYPVLYDATKALMAAAKQAGVAGYAAQWAGQGAPLARAMKTAELVQVLASELEQARSA